MLNAIISEIEFIVDYCTQGTVSFREKENIDNVIMIELEFFLVNVQEN